MLRGDRSNQLGTLLSVVTEGLHAALTSSPATSFWSDEAAHHLGALLSYATGDTVWGSSALCFDEAGDCRWDAAELL